MTTTAPETPVSPPHADRPVLPARVSALAPLHLDSAVIYGPTLGFRIACSCGLSFNTSTPDETKEAHAEHVAEEFDGSDADRFTRRGAHLAARRAAQALRVNADREPDISETQDAISDLIWLAGLIDADEAAAIELRARRIQQQEDDEIEESAR